MPPCCSVVLCNTVIISTISTLPKLKKTKKANLAPKFSIQHHARGHEVPMARSKKTDVVLNSLKVLEWDRLCDVVSSFASTSLGAEAAKEQLWSLDQTYEDSMRLLRETNAAVEIYNYNNVILDLSGINVLLVRSAIGNAQRGFPVTGKEAITIAALLQFADNLQAGIKAAIKDNAEMYSRFMPLVKPILTWIVNGSLIKFIRQILDEDGSVKDSASPTLRKARERLQELERKLYRLLNSLVNEQLDKSMQVRNIDGRWCLRSDEIDEVTSFEGLLLFSGSDVGSIIEPLSAVPLNDELQQARVLVTNAEAEVLLQLTSKMQADLDDMENLLSDVINLDAIVARASYSISFKGTCPELLPPEYRPGPFFEESPRGESNTSGYRNTSLKEWNLYMPKAYHPLLLDQHRQHLKKAKNEVGNAKAEVRRRRVYGEFTGQKEAKEIDIPALMSKVSELENARPVPVDFYIEKKTRVLLITGPNTGGKTICMKTLGLAALMAKTGLYVLCTESARIPWFESVFADIGDEQSLSQSLSTFSGHLKQISDIQAKSSSQSLVLLDEIGAGTNPLEGAALGMSVLESFAEAGALLTIATTHHGELKTLKYSNDAFENACMEFDEVNLKPTYRILWGIPGRSNAINIAERLGLPQIVIDNARDLYGTSSSEIDEVIVEMEKFKNEIQEHFDEAKDYLMLSRDHHEKLLVSQKKLLEHASNLRYEKWQQVSELATEAYSLLHKKMQQHRSSAIKVLNKPEESMNSSQAVARNQAPPINVPQKVAERDRGSFAARNNTDPAIRAPPSPGDLVLVPSLGMKATVLKVEHSKNEIVVQAGNMKMKLKITDVKRS